MGTINLKGEYLPFLKEMGIKYPIINEYYESIMVAGDLNPFGIKLFQKRQKELPMTDEALRLILAIHYLSF